jgi:hypothetical protein
MPSAADFTIASCQATLFTPEAELAPSRFIARLLPTWVVRFDAEPVVIPLPDGVPREVPKVILESRDQFWRCEIASARINLFWRRQKNSAGAISLSQFHREAVPLLHEYQSFIDSRVQRLAAVVNRFVSQDEPAKFLARHFCQDRWLAAPFNRPESFELHSHKRFAVSEDLSVNSWVRNKTGRLTDNNSPIVVVEQDFNTIAEETERNFTPGEIVGFFEKATTEFDSILALYFPLERR